MDNIGPEKLRYCKRELWREKAGDREETGFHPSEQNHRGTVQYHVIHCLIEFFVSQSS